MQSLMRQLTSLKPPFPARRHGAGLMRLAYPYPATWRRDSDQCPDERDIKSPDKLPGPLCVQKGECAEPGKLS